MKRDLNFAFSGGLPIKQKINAKFEPVITWILTDLHRLFVFL